MNPAQTKKEGISVRLGEGEFAGDLRGFEKKPLRFGTRGRIRPIEADEIDRALGLILADQLTHPFYFEHIGRNTADSHDVVAPAANLIDKSVQGGEVEQCARRGYISLNEHQPPGTVKHPERERAFHPRNLVVL